MLCLCNSEGVDVKPILSPSLSLYLTAHCEQSTWTHEYTLPPHCTQHHSTHRKKPSTWRDVQRSQMNAVNMHKSYFHFIIYNTQKYYVAFIIYRVCEYTRCQYVLLRRCLCARATRWRGKLLLAAADFWFVDWHHFIWSIFRRTAATATLLQLKQLAACTEHKRPRRQIVVALLAEAVERVCVCVHQNDATRNHSG